MKGKELSVSSVNPGRGEVAETLLLHRTRRQSQVAVSSGAVIGLAPAAPQRFDVAPTACLSQPAAPSDLAILTHHAASVQFSLMLHD